MAFDIKRLSHLLPHYRIRLGAQRFSELRDRLDDCQRQLREAQAREDAQAAEVAALRARLDALADAPRPYGNLEYAALSAGWPGAAAEGGRILLAGWYGADNLGDELMLRSVLEHLPEEALPRTAVLLWGNPDYERLSLDPRVRAIHYPRSTWDLEQLADTFDTLVWGGGALLDDRQFDANPTNDATGNLLVRLSELVLARGGTVWCLGLSTNAALADEGYLAHLRSIAGRSSAFSLRDPYSLDTLAEAGVPRGALSRCEDLAFGLPKLRELMAERQGAGAQPPLAQGTGSLTVGFVLLQADGEAEANARMVLGVCQGLARETGRAVRALLVPFVEEGSHFDERMNAALRDAMGMLAAADAPEVELAPYTFDLLCSPLLGCDAVVCSKYHAALVAACLGIPTLAVVPPHPHYANKLRHLAELAHLEGALVTQERLAEDPEGVARAFARETARPWVDATVLEEADAYLTDVCAELAGVPAAAGARGSEGVR